MKASVPVESVTCEQVAAFVRNRQVPWPVTVIDVRDDDFQGGCIRNAWHAPHDEAINNLQRLATQIMLLALKHREASANAGHQVVFHCMLSQYRAPHVARELAASLPGFRVSWAEAESALASLPFPKIAVMQGGYERFTQLYYGREFSLFADQPLGLQRFGRSAPDGLSDDAFSDDDDVRSSHRDEIDDNRSHEIDQDEEEEDAFSSTDGSGERRSVSDESDDSELSQSDDEE
ncbi:hypothetical protein CCYA_CCYA06G1864 [Cyanidiococcus yangmingshanensis]|nr:hypothetical protein CCYA_CCYA06G1864 [Cyanidiococcus yangmingshanensis]